jgi:two-component system, NarL family, response regulator, fimbrial Z protein, FimZ
MIKVCLADNHPVVHFGIQSFFKNNTRIEITAYNQNFSALLDTLKLKAVDILVIDAELTGFSSLSMIKLIRKNYSRCKVMIYTDLAENMYTSSAIKAGAAAYIPKTASLDKLEEAILKVNQGDHVFNDDLMKKLDAIKKQNKGERLHIKLSTREVEVLRYLSDGKKNNEVAKILNLNEKTISTYKLRLLIKLNVTNLLDLVTKAKKLDII